VTFQVLLAFSSDMCLQAPDV